MPNENDNSSNNLTNFTEKNNNAVELAYEKLSRKRMGHRIFKTFESDYHHYTITKIRFKPTV